MSLLRMFLKVSNLWGTFKRVCLTLRLISRIRFNFLSQLVYLGKINYSRYLLHFLNEKTISGVLLCAKRSNLIFNNQMLNIQKDKNVQKHKITLFLNLHIKNICCPCLLTFWTIIVHCTMIHHICLCSKQIAL